MADNYNVYSSVLSGVGGLTELGGSISQSLAAKAQGEYASQQLEFNSILSRIQADESLKRGKEAADLTRQRGAKIVGAQRAGYAGGGIDVNFGTPAAMQADTRQQANLDAITLENNAWREAYGFKAQAIGYGGQAAMAKIAGEFTAGQTILTGVNRASSDFIKAGYYGGQAAQDYQLRANAGNPNQYDAPIGPPEAGLPDFNPSFGGYF